MKIKLLFITIIFLIINSCKTKPKFENEDIVNSTEYSKNKISKLYKYTRNYKIKYYLEKNGELIKVSFIPVIYSYVRPLKENINDPEKIYSPQSFYKKSVDYYQKDLNGINVTYLEKDGEIIFRGYNHNYSFDQRSKSINKPTNAKELRSYLRKRNISYKIIKETRKDETSIIEMKANGHFYKIYLNPDLCNSYEVYNEKDSINIKNFSNQINNFYW